MQECHFVWMGKSSGPTSRSRGPWGPSPLSPSFIFKLMQFSGDLGQILGSGPPWGQNSAGPPWLKSWIRLCVPNASGNRRGPTALVREVPSLKNHNFGLGGSFILVGVWDPALYKVPSNVLHTSATNTKIVPSCKDTFKERNTCTSFYHSSLSLTHEMEDRILSIFPHV